MIAIAVISAQSRNFVHHERQLVMQRSLQRSLRVQDTQQDNFLFEPCARKRVVVKRDIARTSLW